MHSEKKKVFPPKKKILPTTLFFSGCNLNHTYSFIWPYQKTFEVADKATELSRYTHESDPLVILFQYVSETEKVQRYKIVVMPRCSIRLKKKISLDILKAYSPTLNKQNINEFSHKMILKMNWANLVGYRTDILSIS